jgi:hypothetical protein
MVDSVANEVVLNIVFVEKLVKLEAELLGFMVPFFQAF